MRAPHHETIVHHRFAAGHLVRFNGGFPSRNADKGGYEVLAQLPPRDGAFQYRIKSCNEPYQRVVKESELESV